MVGFARLLPLVLSVVSDHIVPAHDFTSLLSALSCTPRAGKFPLFFYLCNPKNVSVDLSPSDGVPFTLNGTIAIAPDAGPVKIFSSTTRAIISGGWDGGTAQNGVPIMHNSYGTLELKHLELRHGYGWGTFGAALANNGGTVTLDDVIVQNNSAVFHNGAGGGVFSASVGGIQPHEGKLTIKGGSVFRGNEAGPGSASGDLLLAGGRVSVTGTSFSEIWIAEALPTVVLECDTGPQAGYQCTEVDAQGYNGTSPFKPHVCYSCEIV
jgi:hypothetical protein